MTGSCNDLSLAPGHYLNQRWPIDNWALTEKLQWNLYQSTTIFIHFDLDVFNHLHYETYHPTIFRTGSDQKTYHKTQWYLRAAMFAV